MNLANYKKLYGKSVGITYGCFCPLHQGHLDMIFQAKKENDAGCIVIVCGYNGDRGEENKMPLLDRYYYVRQFFKEDDKVSVLCVNDSEIENKYGAVNWDTWLKEVSNLIQSVVNINLIKKNWYVGEQEYYNGLLNYKEYANQVTLLDRYENKISGTEIRNHPIQNWNNIAYTYRHIFSHNILISGTASEGKTTLVNDIGKYFNIPSCLECGKDYVTKKSICDWELDGTDFLAFLHDQYQLSNEKILNNEKGIFLSDTDSIVTKMYANHYARKSDFKLTEEEYELIRLSAQEYTEKINWSKIFLLKPTNSFVDDGIRCMKDANFSIRTALFNNLCNFYKEAGLWNKVQILEGNYYDNFLTVKNYIKEVLKNG